jgi:hypothetical protein
MLININSKFFLSAICPLKVISSHKRGGSRKGYKWIVLAFLHNRRCFLHTLKGLLLGFKFQKPVKAFRALKRWSLFYGKLLTKTQKCVVTFCYTHVTILPLLPLERQVEYCYDRVLQGQVWKQNRTLLQISSDTPPVVMAAVVVSSDGL